MGPSRWKVITPSEFPWEQEAFDFIRSQLPDADPYFAWQGFNFISDQGSIYEVDVLVHTPFGFFLIEVKSRPGLLRGDAGTWTWLTDGRVFSVDNPTLLADSKSKKLVGLLRRQKAFKDLRAPFLEPLIFCSAPGLQVDLPDHARKRLCVRDRAASDVHEARPGIIAALTRGQIDGVSEFRLPHLDKTVMNAVARGMEQAGIRQSERYRVISDYRLKQLLMEGRGWQDWEGVHVSLPENSRRIRRYTLAAAASEEERQMLLRAARREYQILDGLNHPGILGVKGFTDNQYGPAIIFEHHPKAVRLDHYLAGPGAKTAVDVRLAILRQVAEAMRYAHGKGMFHRGLSPQSVLVIDPDVATPVVKIFSWQTGSKELLSSTNTPGGRAVTGTAHVDQLLDEASTAYMAPEAVLDHERGGEPLDVFSLGALAYHLFAGRPPATSFLELSHRVRESRGLQISAVVDGVATSLQDLIQFATDPEVPSRLASVGDFLAELEKVEEELTAPPREETIHPLDAKKKGERLEHGYIFKSRIGAGSTSVALLVDQGTDEMVLKVARTPEFNERLLEEAEVLNKLRHQHIVEVHKTVQMHGLVAIVLQRAGDKTLAKRIAEDGRLHPDLLQRFGEDLLLTVDWLEQKGISHRDLKPDNIGVMPVGRGDQLHLVLFDFSLSRTPAENIRAGTARYLDPFLALRKPPRWDSAAERWSAAVTLYEMAAGPTNENYVLRWGDGRTDPAMLSCEVTIDGDRFDPEVREGLVAFFTRALRRDPAQRFDNCRDMLEAWRDLFKGTGPAEADDSDPAIDLAAAIAGATLDTPVTALGLAKRALTSLDRLNVDTVRQLLSMNLRRVWRLRGVGHKTRRHLAEMIGKLRVRFPDVQPVAADAEGTSSTGHEPAATVWSVDRLVQTITGGSPAKKADVELRGLRAFLNLDRLDTPALCTWPSQTDVATELKVGKPRVNQWLESARQRWRKNPSLTAVRAELVELLDAHGGVMSAGELSRALLATRGSNQVDEDYRCRLASAVVRAAVETERGMVQSRLNMRRRGDAVIVAKVYDEDEPNALCDYAVRLGDEADKLAATEPLPTPLRVADSLRRVRSPNGAPILNERRLVTLAASVSQSAAASSKMEVYPRGMAAGRALKLGLGALGGVRELTLDQIRERVHGRYPDAHPLPGRPELDQLLREAGWPYAWDEATQAYRPVSQLITTTTTGSLSLTRFPTGGGSTIVTPDVAEARDFEDRLGRALDRGGFVALSVAPKNVNRAASDLTDRFGLDIRNLDELFIRGLQAQSEARRVNWEVVLKADAEGPAGRDWSKLLMLVRSATDQVAKEILASPRPVLLLYPGLIGRYDQLPFIDRLRDGSGRAGSVPSVWLLLAADQQSTLPMIDNRPVPVLGHGQWARIPDGWLRNAHRTDQVTLSTVLGGGSVQ
jgi:serine/threonine protein kinase